MKLLATICEILTRLIDTQSRVARIETRLMNLANQLAIDVRRKPE